MKLILTRLRETEKETLGILHVYDDIEKVFECKTLELPDRQNVRNISCIPKGNYKIAHRWSPKYKDHLILVGVENRSYILCHTGNFYFDTRGCILVGRTYADLNGDGELDVSSSRQTMTNLMKVIDDKLDTKPNRQMSITIL